MCACTRTLHVLRNSQTLDLISGFYLDFIWATDQNKLGSSLQLALRATSSAKLLRAGGEQSGNRRPLLKLKLLELGPYDH